MNIRQLIDALEERAELSDKGYDAEVKLNLHTVKFNSSGYYIETKIADVSNVWGVDTDEVHIDTVLSEEDIERLQELKNEYVTI